jgi:hypothetical protein
MDGIIKKAKASTFTKTYATSILLSETDSDIRIYSFNEMADFGQEKVAISEGAVIMTDQATVLLYEQLRELMEKWKADGKYVEVSAQRREILEKMKDKK